MGSSYFPAVAVDLLFLSLMAGRGAGSTETHRTVITLSQITSGERLGQVYTHRTHLKHTFQHILHCIYTVVHGDISIVLPHASHTRLPFLQHIPYGRHTHTRLQIHCPDDSLKQREGERRSTRHQ